MAYNTEIMRKQFILTGIAILLFLITSRAQVQRFPTKNWDKTELPTLYGWNSSKLQSLHMYIIDSTAITGMMIIHNGIVIYEFGNVEENSYIASCRKSILAMLFGKYVSDGTIDLSKTMEELQIDRTEHLLPIEKKASIRDIISARSGIYLIGSNDGDLRKFAPERGTKEPGEFWLYNNWDFNMAGDIFEKLTNRNIYDEIESQFAIPLQMQDWDRNIQVKSGDKFLSDAMAYHMWFSTRDMARLGLLMLNKGKWIDSQIIDKDWVEEMTSPITTNEEINNVFNSWESPWSYGYMWWLLDKFDNPYFKGAYSALGAWGQTITVFPEINTVLVIKTNSSYERKTLVDEIIKKVPDYFNHNLAHELNQLRLALENENIDEFVIEARKTHKLKGSIPSEDMLNRLGYYFIRGEKLEASLRIFQLNVELYPHSSNVYDSLGEAYYKVGNYRLAIENYKKSLERIDPDNILAKKRVKQIIDRINLNH